MFLSYVIFMYVTLLTLYEKKSIMTVLVKTKAMVQAMIYDSNFYKLRKLTKLIKLNYLRNPSSPDCPHQLVRYFITSILLFLYAMNIYESINW